MGRRFWLGGFWTVQMLAAASCARSVEGADVVVPTFESSQSDDAYAVDVGVPVPDGGAAPGGASDGALAVPRSVPDEAPAVPTTPVSDWELAAVAQAQEAAELIVGTRSIAYDWAPWWLAPAPSGTSGGVLWLTVEVIEVSAGPALEGYYIDAEVTLRDRDGRFDVRFECAFEGRSSALGRDLPVALSAQFEQPQLSEQLGLPPSAFDPFVLRLAPESEGLHLYSDRGGFCPLLRSVPRSVPECGDGESSFRGLESRVLTRVTLDEPLVEGLTPREPVAAIEALGPLRVTWPDGTQSPLQVAIEPEGWACVSRGIVPEGANDDVVPDRKWLAGQSFTQVLTPVVFGLETADGRLLAGLPGRLLVDVFEETGWDGTVRGHGGMTPLGSLSDGERAGFEPDEGSLALLSITLNAPLEDGLVPRLSLNQWTPYPGVPEYPDVHESASNRPSCFGADRHTLTARITPR